MERVDKISKVFLRFHFLPFFVISFILILLFPLFFGIENLAFVESANVYERIFPIIGLVLFIPLFLPDCDRNTLEVIQTKKTSYLKILSIRLVQIFITLLFFTIICLIIFQLKNSEIKFGQFLFGGVADVCFLAGLMCLIFSLTMQPVTGLIAPIAYYIICLFTGDKYLKTFYFFTLVNEDFHSKLLLLTVGIILITISCFVANKRK
ncbi:MULTISPECIES: hypothetical protein [unclassified Lysinibacillus]|uniref:hypothetical protein n=1 Tax=unclassified Lysinibacillus TaxID=2636778 RepID=UPI00380CBFDB